MTRSEPNPQQKAAIGAAGTVFVSAGAGTGKTRVLVERFVEAVTVGGLDVGSILVVTFTEKAAAELAARIRARLTELGRHDLARALDTASIHTIHGYCRRLLAAYPLEAGIDPRFRVLPAPHARVLQGEAFATALGSFCAANDPERWRLVAAYGSETLRSMLLDAYETLRSAGRELVLETAAPADLTARVEELRVAAAELGADSGVTERQQDAVATTLALLDVSTLPERLIELDGVRAQGARAAVFEAARKGTLEAAWEALAERDRHLLQELLTAFADAYASAKQRESALDFEDLQIRARDLLVGVERVRVRERDRYRAVMVDEFQDTNRLQTALIEELAGGADTDALFVGDECQSIYGFRHADVGVFRERRDATSGIHELTLNYRSEPGVLDAVNELFTVEWGTAFRPLEAASSAPATVSAPRFELLVTDKAAAAVNGEHWRRSEARHVAGRVRELVDAGEATPGEIVLLFAAGTDAALYEDELRAVGLPAQRLTRTSYWGQQQVADLLAYLRLLRNRTDDEALLTVLASPFVGVTNDALMLISDAAPRNAALWYGIDPRLPSALDPEDARLLQAFLQRYGRLVGLSSRLSLEHLCERILVEHDYDLAVLARPDGARRFANLRKLAQLARDFESLRGADLEGFIALVEDQESLGGRIDDAVSEEEGGDAVRLMTIHSAKGLEFPVVVVADAGRGRPGPPDIICLSDGRFGFKVAHPVTGKQHGTASYAAVSAARTEAERTERLRLYYVGMTRAMRRLIVSGSVDAENHGEATPIAWVLDRLDLSAEVARADGPVEFQRGGARVLLSVDRGKPDRDPVTPSAASTVQDEPFTAAAQLDLFGETEAPATAAVTALMPLAAPPEPPALWPERLSYSAIGRFRACPYRFYVERISGLRATAVEGKVTEGALTALAGNEIGDAAHRALETVDLGAPSLPPALDDMVRSWYPAATDADLGRVTSLVQAFCSSALAARISGLTGARVEQGFVFGHDGLLVDGRLDLYHRNADGALVVDFKTDALHGRSPDELVEQRYTGQRALYALAALRAGAASVEVIYQFLEAPDSLISATFGPDDLPELEQKLSADIAAIREGRFPARPNRFVCSDCPALGRVCAGTGSGAFAAGH